MLSLWSEYGLSRYALKEAISATAIGRSAFQRWTEGQASIAELRGNKFLHARNVCQAMRLLEGRPISARLADGYAQVLADAGIRGDARIEGNLVRQSYLGSATAGRGRARYLRHGKQFAAAMKFPRTNDDIARQGNLLVLKPTTTNPREKGVLYLQYTESISEFVALFDLERVAREYRLVLEPSTWGYQDESYLMLVEAGFDVVVQAQDSIDYRHILDLKSNLHPVRLGAGDWIDPVTFASQTIRSKDFDFVMVASWSPVKRHSLLFWALARAGLSQARLALIGYPWEGRTRADIEKAARKYGLENVTIFERIPRQQVADVISRSRVGVMLTRREGANRGIYECLFCDVPVVIPAYNRGVNKDHVNTATGMLADDASLPQVLGTMLENHANFRPREWAMAHTGYRNAYRILDDELRRLAHASGEPYTDAIAMTKSAPAARYVNDSDRVMLQGQYAHLQSLLRTDDSRKGGALK